ncbi:MAG: hypothetical protein H0W16_00670 [Actinobacteria bacterium]|nr:hypothetical protein [Actinomycetota bacterium]
MRNLASEEGGVHRRFSLRRNRWADVADFDRRVGELEQRRVSLNDELDALTE